MYSNQLEQDQAISRFAAGSASLAELQRNGLESVLAILKRLGELGLRPPTAPLEGPNAELRKRGRAVIAERIRLG